MQLSIKLASHVSLLLILCASRVLAADPVDPYSVDKKFKALGEDNIIVGDHTRDACDRNDDVTIKSRDGDVILKPGETRYFAVPKDTEYGRTGGWIFYCGKSEECARIRDSNYIKAVRKQNGVIDWYSVQVKI